MCLRRGVRVREEDAEHGLEGGEEDGEVALQTAPVPLDDRRDELVRLVVYLAGRFGFWQVGTLG